MINSRLVAGIALALVSVTLSVVEPAAAQSPQPVEARQVPPGPATQTAPARDAEETRRTFYQVLEQYPPALGYVLRLDPTLLTNPAYLSVYPSVASFVAQ